MAKVSRKTWALVSVVSAFVLVAALVGGLGGFQARTGVSMIWVEAGSEVDVGMMVFRVTAATAAHHPDATQPWEVTVVGSVRNPNTETLRPIEGWNGSVSGTDRTLYDDQPQYVLGPVNELGRSDRRVVPPDNQWMDISLVFQFEQTFEPGNSFVVVFRPLDYTVTSVLGFSEQKDWAVDSYSPSFAVEVPLIVSK